MMRLVDVLYALPSIVFVIVLLTTLNGVLDRFQARGWSGETARTVQLLGLFVGLGAVSWLTMARIVRGEVLSLRTRAFVDASRALGAGHARILWHHILPNVLGIVIVYLALTVPAVVLYESFLSYLGLGLQPPQASLGSLIAEGAVQINPLRVYWWIIVFPAASLALLLLALNFLGDALRDALDPRSTTAPAVGS
jgi:oligopeptide transport system permease protein